MKRVLATILLAPPTLGFIGFTWTFFLETKASIEKANSNEHKIIEIERKIYDIHWYLIERNNIKVPKRSINGIRSNR